MQKAPRVVTGDPTAGLTRKGHSYTYDMTAGAAVTVHTCRQRQNTEVAAWRRLSYYKKLNRSKVESGTLRVKEEAV